MRYVYDVLDFKITFQGVGGGGVPKVIKDPKILSPLNTITSGLS